MFGRLRAVPFDEAVARRWGWAVIALVVLLVYWPLSSFGWSVSPHDTLNCWLPWRWAMASFLQDGHLPHWNPYQQFGYPQYADLQGPAWYVEALTLGGTVGHGIQVLQGLFLLYVIIGGTGMMRLSRTLHGDDRSALVIGVAYALGGFFTAHQMHLYAVISAAWLPWAFDAVVRLLRSPGKRVALEAALFHYLLLSGGNHTFMIIGAYLETALGMVFLVKAWREGGWAHVYRLGVAVMLFVGVTMVLACGTLYAVYEVYPLMSRGGGLDLAHAADGPFTWYALRSLFFPSILGQDPARLGTNITMANGFMGLLVAALACLAFFRKRDRVENVLLIAGGIAALAAFGSALPVHGWLWRHVPGMDLFRFPAYFRWFTWLAVMVLASGSLQAWRNGAWSGRTVAIAWWSVALVGLLVVVSLPPFGPPAGSDPATWYERITEASSMERIARAVPVPLAALVLAGLMAWRKRLGAPGLLLCVVVEMGWSTTWAQWDTAVGPVAPALYGDRLAQLPPGPNFPTLDAMDRHTDQGDELHYLMYNVHDYFGRPARTGYNSFWLSGPAELQLEHAPLWEAMGRQPLLYLSDRTMAPAGYIGSAIDPRRDSALVVLPAGIVAPVGLGRLPSDSLAVVGFDAQGITVTTRTGHPTILVLQQSHYPGWRVWIDDVPAELWKVNIAAMGVLLPAGTHRVEFRSERPLLGWLLALSMVALFAILYHLAWTGPAPVLRSIGVSVLGAALLWSLFAHRPKTERVPAGLAHFLERPVPEKVVVVNTDRAAALELRSSIIPVRADRAKELVAVIEAIDPDRPLHWIEAGSRAHASVRAWLKDRMRVVRRETHQGVEAIDLVPSDHPMEGRTWGADPAGKPALLHGGIPFGAAIEVPLEELAAFAGKDLVVDLEALGAGAAEASLVIERRRGDRVTDYRRQALSAGDPAAWWPNYVVVPVDELYRPGEQLRIYAWQPGADTVGVRHLRVRVVEEPLRRW